MYVVLNFQKICYTWPFRSYLHWDLCIYLVKFSNYLSVGLYHILDINLCYVTVQVFSSDHRHGYTKARYFARCLPLCCWGLYDKWQRFANIYVHADGSVGRLDNQGPAIIFSEVTPRSLRILPSVRRAESVWNNTKEPSVLYVWGLPHHGLCLGLFYTTACRPSQQCSKQQIFVVC
jgi:hypothetical protein